MRMIIIIFLPSLRQYSYCRLIEVECVHRIRLAPLCAFPLLMRHLMMMMMITIRHIRWRRRQCEPRNMRRRRRYRMDQQIMIEVARQEVMRRRRANGAGDEGRGGGRIIETIKYADARWDTIGMRGGGSN